MVYMEKGEYSYSFGGGNWASPGLLDHLADTGEMQTVVSETPGLEDYVASLPPEVEGCFCVLYRNPIADCDREDSIDGTNITFNEWSLTLNDPVFLSWEEHEEWWQISNDKDYNGPY
jgi:hypothetical protein